MSFRPVIAGMVNVSGGAGSVAAITSGTITGLTGFALRDTSAAFDLTFGATSTTPLTAGRSVTWDVNNTSQSLIFTGASTITFPSGTATLAKLGANTFTGAQTIGTIDGGGGAFYFDPNGLRLSPTAWLGFCPGAPSSGHYDAGIVRVAANILAQRRIDSPTTAQTMQWYGTYTDASNYVRASLAATSTLVTLAAETAGTGADDIDIALTPAGVGNVIFPGGVLLKTSAALTDGAAAQSATMTNGPAAGNPTKWIPINDNGTTRYIPAW